MSQQLLDLAWASLKERLAKFAGRCSIEAWVAPGFDERVAKRAVHLLSQELRTGLQRDRVLFVAVPSGQFEREVVRIDWISRDHPQIRMVAYQSEDGVYGCPPAVEPTDWAADLQYVDSLSIRQLPAFRVLSVQRPSSLLLRVDFPRSNRPLSGLANGEAHEITTVDRIRKVIDDANEQLRSGQQHRALAGVLTVYFDHLGGGQHDDLMRACFGDLTYLIDTVTKTLRDGHYGLNGAFRPNKNTAVSAIVYRSRRYPTLSLVNPYGRYPINPKWLPGRVTRISNSGEVLVG
ncbi:MAG: hypothetical protein WD793_13470 [Steroidobacteraceae bacterium]